MKKISKEEFGIKGRVLKKTLCVLVALSFLLPLSTTIVNASDPVEKYAIIVAGGASTKLKQTSNYGSGWPPYIGTYAYYKNGSSWTDYTFYVDLMTTDDIDSDNEEIGALFRYQNANKYYRLRWENKDGTNDKMYLDKIVNGHHTMLATKKVKLDRDVWYTLKIRLNGNSIRVDYQKSLPGLGVQAWIYVFGITDSSLSSGTIALYCWRDKGAWFDDVLVKKDSEFIDLDFESKDENDTKGSVFDDHWTTVNGDWDLTIADNFKGEMDHFVEDQEDFYLECNEVYKILKENEYTENNIKYLSVDKWADADNDGDNDIDSIATNSSIEEAFDWMASVSDGNDKCLIYMFSHGQYTGNRVNPPHDGFFFVDNTRDGIRLRYLCGYQSSDKIWDYDIGGWIDKITDYGVEIFIMEACYAGVFTDDIGENSNNRIVITSTDHAHWANPWKPNGQKTDKPVFSYNLFERLCPPYNYNFADAFNYARNKSLENNQYYGEEKEEENQYPWLDDNGNGVAVNASVPVWDGYGYDGYLAQDTYL